MVVSPAGLGSENDCAGESSKLETTDHSPRQRECYIRTMTARVQLKIMLVVSLKELVAKTN
jgi:hypothetical protein